MTPSSFDFSPFVRSPRISAVSGVVLTIRLLRVAAQHKPLAPHVFEALVDMRDAAEEVRRILEVRRGQRTRDLRQLDRVHDGAWAGMHMRIDAHVRVGRQTMEAAAQLLGRVYPTGLSFLKNGYDEQWLHSDTLLASIEKDEQLRAQIVELAGQYFLDAVLEAHAAMTAALGFGEDGDSEPAPIAELGPGVQALGVAIGSYGRACAGMVKLSDPASLARFEALMAPRAQHLAQQSKASRGPASGEVSAGAVSEEQADALAEAESEADAILDELDLPLPQPEAP